jgi:hypothetical protein
MPDTPEPSSRMREVGSSREEVKRKFVGEESQVDRRGVMSHTTVGELGGNDCGVLGCEGHELIMGFIQGKGHGSGIARLIERKKVDFSQRDGLKEEMEALSSKIIQMNRGPRHAWRNGEANKLMHEARLTWVYKCESEKSVTPTCARSPFLSVGGQQAR